MGLRQMLSESKLLVHFLVCCLGIASWVDINGTWVELPILVTSLPEGWTLPSYFIISSQIANIGPIIFSILVYCCNGVRLEKPTSGLIIVVGMAACLLLAFFWDRTTVVFDEPHATALLSLVLALAFVDCTSSMAFLAFMAWLKPLYLPSYFIGEGFSGMLPSLIALAQGAGSVVCVNSSQTSANFTDGVWYNETTYIVYPNYETPRFSVQVFFLIIFGLMTLSFVSFLLITFHPYCKREHVASSSYSLDNTSSCKSTSVYKQNAFDEPFSSKQKLAENGKRTKETDDSAFKSLESMKKDNSTTKSADNENGEELSPLTYGYLLIMTVVINMQIVSFLLSIQTYTTLPYGLDTYHLSATIANIANPVACFANLVFPAVGVRSITILAILGSAFSTYLIIIAANSPVSPLVGTAAGGPLAITSWALVSFLLTYAKVGIATRLRGGGRKPMLLCGAFTQVGALVGSIVAFLLVNVYKLFKDAPFC